MLLKFRPSLLGNSLFCQTGKSVTNWKEGVCLNLHSSPNSAIGCVWGAPIEANGNFQQIAAAIVKEEDKTTYRFCQGKFSLHGCAERLWLIMHVQQETVVLQLQSHY